MNGSVMRDEGIADCLVTGGAGFVGSSLTRALLRRPDTRRIFVLDNFFNGRREYLPDDRRVVIAEIDLRDAAAVNQVVTEVAPQVIFHLAALHFIPYCNAHPAECLDVNVIGTENLLEACRQTPPKRLLVVSSAAVYPICDEPCGEETVPPGPTDVYGLSKWINEKQTELFARNSETRCSAVRLFNVYGPRETNPHVLPVILDQVMAGASELSLGNVEPRRDYIHVEDVASGLVAVADRNDASFRCYNLGTGEEYSVRDLVNELSRLCGRPLQISTDPNRVRKSDRMHLRADRTRITSETGWEPKYDLRSGLSQLWEWTKAIQSVAPTL